MSNWRFHLHYWMKLRVRKSNISVPTVKRNSDFFVWTFVFLLEDVNFLIWLWQTMSLFLCGFQRLRTPVCLLDLLWWSPELYKVKGSKKFKWVDTQLKLKVPLSLSSRTRCREMGIFNSSWASTHLNFFWTSLSLYSSDKVVTRPIRRNLNRHQHWHINITYVSSCR